MLEGGETVLPLLCVTNRALCAGGEDGLLRQLARVLELPQAASRPAPPARRGEASSPTRPVAVLLREKDLDAQAYAQLAGRVAKLCRAAGVPLAIHTHAQVARGLECRHLHLTLPVLQALPEAKRTRLAAEFELSTSCHAVDDALQAAALGCTRIIAGHVYETDCKPGLEPRGLAFLRAVCAATLLPVWAIGGVEPCRLPELRAAGAAGACLMSAFMRC